MDNLIEIPDLVTLTLIKIILHYIQVKIRSLINQKMGDILVKYINL